MEVRKYNEAEGDELYADLVEALGLKTHTITFHFIERGDSIDFGSGMITCKEDLNDSDAFNLIADNAYDEPTIHIDDLPSYQLGEGESDDATWSEIETLEDFQSASPKAFDSMLTQYGELMCSLYDFDVANPAYESEESDEE